MLRTLLQFALEIFVGLLRVIDLLPPLSLAQAIRLCLGRLDALTLGIHLALHFQRQLALLLLQRRLLGAQCQFRLAVTGKFSILQREFVLQGPGPLGTVAARLLDCTLCARLELCPDPCLVRCALRQLLLQSCNLLAKPPRRRAVGIRHQGLAQLSTFAFEHRLVFGFIALDQLMGNGILQHEFRSAMRTGHGVEGVDDDLLCHAGTLLSLRFIRAAAGTPRQTGLRATDGDRAARQ